MTKNSLHRVPPAVILCGEEQLVLEYARLLERTDATVYIWHPTKLTLPGLRIKYNRSLSNCEKNVIAAFELSNLSGAQKVNRLRKLEEHCAKQSLLITSSITETVTALSAHLRAPQRLIGIAAMPTFIGNGHLEVAAGPLTRREYLSVASGLFADLGLEISVVDDRMGMVLPRIVCCLVNEAVIALQENVASEDDIDTAMKLGTNYPHGPIEWGKKIGFDQILIVMEALHHDTGDDRYRVSPLLRKLALGKSIAGKIVP
jgi:3-hydroxybutyryl-CoA dehydrogenase